MQIETAVLHGFRNIDEAHLTFSPQLTLFIGNNGQGKTNVLEALHLVLTGATFRSGAAQDLVSWTASQSSIAAVVRTEQIQKISASHRTTKNPLRKKHEGPILPVVIFSPDDVQLSKGAPAGRRRFLDWLLASVDARYLRLYRQYNRALLQRNQALKNPRLWSTVSSFNHALSEAGLYLWRRRQDVLQQIVPEAQLVFSGLTGMTMNASLQQGGAAAPLLTVEDYEHMLEIREEAERKRGMTLTGPHRDDVIVTIDGTPALAYASQGQHRTIALSLKLASYHVMQSETGMVPIILLDDVLSELDPQKRARLLLFIAENQPQTIVTDTEARNFQNLHPLVYEVEQGRFSRWPS